MSNFKLGKYSVYKKRIGKGAFSTVYKGVNKPINLGSGQGVSIKTIAELISKSVPNGPLKIVWDKSKPSGDKIRLMDTSKAKKIGFKTEVDIFKGINNTINWYLNSKKYKRYNAFTENF